MGVLTDLAGLGALGKRAQDFASGRGAGARNTPKRANPLDDAFEDVPGTEPIPGSGMDENDRRRNKRGNGKQRT